MMSMSVPSGRWGPCCSIAAKGSTAMTRAMSVARRSVLVRSRQWRLASMRESLGAAGKVSKARPDLCSARPPHRSVRMRYARALAALLFLCAASHALALDRVTFATNWLAEAEHGGFYQALTDGTYERYGLDVKIIQGGPQLNN